MSFHPRSVLALVALIAMLALTPATAAPGHRSDHEQARRALMAGEVLPLRSVLRGISRDYPGRVMHVGFERDRGGWVYKIKLLQKGGRLLKLKVDAPTGTVIDVKKRKARHKRKN